MTRQPPQPIKQTMFGRAAPSLGWVPSPSYLLRRDRILRTLDKLPRGNVLEIGCGAGALLSDLVALGFSCTALEQSDEARQISREINNNSDRLVIRSEADSNWDMCFDYVMAFEVLEHIDEDLAALRQWTQWLRRDGYLMLSVPAHQSRWNASDVWAGHYRRYDRSSLWELCNTAGLVVEKWECYGFPLANMVHPIRTRIHRRRMSTRERSFTASQTRAENTCRSGIERCAELRFYPLLCSWPGRLVMSLFCNLQRAFLRTELGNGYLIMCRRAENEN